jgi:phosphonate transport system substrate-binding protein
MLNIKHIALILSTILFTAVTINSEGNGDISAKGTYTVGYMKNLFSEVDVNDAKAAIKVWINEIVKMYYNSGGIKLKAKLYNSCNEVKETMKADSLALLGMNSFDYLTYGSKIGLDPILVPSAEGDIFSRYYILIRNDSKFKTILDLKGAKLGLIAGTNHIVSRIWLDVLLAKNNIPDKSQFFNNIVTSNKESQLILSLFFGHLDVCIVSTGSLILMKELNPQVGEKIIPLQTSSQYLWGLLCFTKTYTNESEKNTFLIHAQHVHEFVTGKQLFSLIKIEKLVSFKNEYLNSYKDLLKEYNYLVKTKKIKYDEFN